MLNEPWLGDIYEDPDLLIPGLADKKNVARLNEAIHEAIRAVDTDRIIFYEPATGGNILDATPVGYASLPGDVPFQNRSALSYHIYCPLLESDMPYHPTNDSFWTWVIEAFELGACDLLNTYQYDVRYDDAKRLGVAGFMTEFGAILNNNTFSMDYVYYATEKMDQFFHGWTFWCVIYGNATEPWQEETGNMVDKTDTNEKLAMTWCCERPGPFTAKRKDWCSRADLTSTIHGVTLSEPIYTDRFPCHHSSMIRTARKSFASCASPRTHLSLP